MLKYFHSFNIKFLISIKISFRVLKNYEDKTFIVDSPDKGNGIVLLNKHGCIEKIHEIVADPVNFSKVSDELYLLLVKH